MAKNVMISLIQTGEVRRGYLGVSIGDLDPELAEQFGTENTNGAVVTQVYPDTPAEEAGLKVYDVITAINGRLVMSQPDLRLKISQITPGEEIRMDVLRDGMPMELIVTLANLSDATLAEDTSTETVELLSGVTILEMTDELREQFRIGQTVQGLVVAEVSSDSDYSEDLKAGMVIMGINRKKVETLGEAFEFMTPGKNLLYIYFEGRNNFLVIRKD
jgi:serine protease Do